MNKREDIEAQLRAAEKEQARDRAELKKAMEMLENAKKAENPVIEPESEEIRPKPPKEETIDIIPQSEKTPVLETPEEKEVKKEIENFSSEEKEKLGWGLATIGFKVEKAKNDFFATILNPTTKTNIDKKGTLGRFLNELYTGFKRDSENAEKKAREVMNKEKKHRFANVGFLAGNVLKYGRTIADLTGKSVASPLRYVMMAGMTTARVAEAGKEARLKNEEVIEKTRIQDVELAAEEAWRIYNNAEAKTGKGNVSVEVLKNIYLSEMPKDLQKRLEIPSTANKVIQRIVKRDVEGAVSRLNKKLDNIDNDSKLSTEQKEAKKQKLINKWKKSLVDYDRIITQYGTVDGLAMAGRYAQTAGKAIVAAVMAETIVLSVEKIWGVLSSAIHNNAIALTDATLAQETSEKIRPGILPNNKVEPLEGDTGTIASETVDTSIEVNQDAIVGKGEGIEHALRRQIEHDEALAKMLGYEGDPSDTEALHKFSGGAAHRLALEHGYVDKTTGEEIWIKEGDKVAYEIKVGADGQPVINERLVEGGELRETHSAGHEFEKDIEKEYEYKHPRYQAPVFDAIAEKIPDTSATLEEATAPAGENLAAPDDEAWRTRPVAPEDEVEKVRRILGEKYDTRPPVEDNVARVTGYTEPDVYSRYPGPEARVSGYGYGYRHGYGNLYTDPYDPKFGRGNVYAYIPELGGYQHYFEGLSDIQMRELNYHPEFANNPFNLSGPEVWESYETSRENIDLIFGNEYSVAWNSLRKLNVGKVLEMGSSENPTQTRFADYVRDLQNYTHLGLRSSWFGLKKETVEQYIARALQKLTSEGNLGKFQRGG